MLRLIFVFVLCLSTLVQAETPESLSQKNAFPNEIRDRMDQGESEKIIPKRPDVVLIGTVVSLLRRNREENLYDFTIALTDDTVITVTQTDEFGLKPNDMVSIQKQNDKFLIKDKISE